MKKLLFITNLFLFISICINAQTNTYPTNGTVDIFGDINLQGYNATDNGPLRALNFFNYYPSSNSILAQIQARRGNGSYQKGDLAFYVKNGTSLIEALRIVSNGRIGIGTSNPTSHFSAGSLINLKSFGNSEIVLDHSDGGSASDIGILSFERNSDHLAHIRAQHDGATDSAFLSFHTQTTGGSFSNINSNERMRIASNGNVGIGTTSPNHELTVEGASSPNIELKNSNYSNGGFIINRTNYGHQWKWWAESNMMYFGFSTDETNYSNKFTIKSNGNVGIGSGNPLAGLEIFKGNTNNLALLLKSSGLGWGSGLQLENTSGNKYGIYSGSDGKWHFSHEGQGDRFIVDASGNIGIGTTNTHGFKLGVKGSIAAEEVKVQVYPWSDFVFKKEYNLPSLEEVEQHIKDQGHLKDIPSAAEVEKDGIFLGDMDSKLLQKIEELTLYTIEQGKELQNQKILNKNFEEELKKLEIENQVLKSLLERVKKLEEKIKF